MASGTSLPKKVESNLLCLFVSFGLGLSRHVSNTNCAPARPGIACEEWRTPRASGSPRRSRERTIPRRCPSTTSLKSASSRVARARRWAQEEYGLVQAKAVKTCFLPVPHQHRVELAAIEAEPAANRLRKCWQEPPPPSASFHFTSWPVDSLMWCSAPTLHVSVHFFSVGNFGKAQKEDQKHLLRETENTMKFGLFSMMQV